MNLEVVKRFLEQLQPAFREGDANAAAKTVEIDNIRQLEEQYRAIVRGDYAGVVAMMAEDIDLEIIGPPSVPLAGRWQGRERVAEALARNFGMVEDQQPVLQSVTAQGDTVVVIARERGRWKPTGRTYDVHWIQVFTFRDGKLARVREFVDSAAFLEAVLPPGK
jgi:hypothetical protein